MKFQYDALGRRTKRTQGSDVQKYSYDGQDAVLDNVNNTVTKYQNGPGIDNKLKQITGSTSKYFLADHLGGTNGLANSSGFLTSSNAYDSFGKPTNSSFSSRYQFTGREYDSLTGLQYSRARFYDPQIGRFISEDPIGFGGGDVNLYAYVWNDPIHFTDPSGEAVPIIIWGIFEVCSTGYDIYDFSSTLADPNADWIDYSIGGGGLLAGTFLPGGGYGTLGKGLRRFGRRGNPTTRGQLDEIRDQFLDNHPDYRHVGGGRNRFNGEEIPEEFLPNPNGGRKGGSYPDLTFAGPGGDRIRFNTYDANPFGIPTRREADAADRLFGNGNGSPVILIPKRKCIPCKE